MYLPDSLDTLYVVSAFFIQIILIAHFVLRKWNFDLAVRYGWIVYALGILMGLVSIMLILGGKAWCFWIAGYIYFIWGIYGYWVEYVRRIDWRNPVRWSIFGPYVFLYLAMILFYWWPLALLDKRLWYIYALLFISSSLLNITSHRKNVQLSA